jgi:glucosamine-6-phosphate deaminase
VRVKTFVDRAALGRAAAADAARAIRAAIADRGSARIVAATGASQFDFLDALVRAEDIDWPRVELFHLDEYVGLPVDHPASFRRYLLDRLIGPAGIVCYHLLNGEADPARAAADVGAVLAERDPDVAFVGIGENAHLAFNDPPADFGTTEPYVIVTLDEACRRQQVGEGWFPALADVPARAISMSVRQILKAREIVAVVPDARKAQAVHACLEGPLSPMAPASILRTHPRATIYLDRASAARLSPSVRGDVLDGDAA